MSIYYSSEADLCLLCSQLCLLIIFCLPEKNEDWGQNEKWGEGRQRRPNLKLQGRHNWITQVKQEVCSRDQPEAHILSEGSRFDSAPSPWAPSGVGWAGGSLLWMSLHCLLQLTCSSSPGSAATGVLCLQEARFLPSTVPRLPSRFPWFSRLPLARLETQASQDLPLQPWAALAPPSSFRAGLMGCLVFITETFLAHSFSIPDGGMRRATKDISEFPWMCMLDEPSLLISESFCSKKIVLYSYLKPLENLQTGNGDTSKSYCYMTKASCKTTRIICLTELKMNLYYLCK